MIDMSVRDQNGVAAINAGAQTLLAMVGWDIDQDHARLASGVGELQHGACAQALVTRVGALACGAVAANHGHAGTCACSKQRERGVESTHQISRPKMCGERTVIWNAVNFFVKTTSCGMTKVLCENKNMLHAQSFL